MSEQLWIAVIGTAGTVVVAGIGVIGGALLKKVERVRAQVENDHRHPDGTPIVMRDEQDQRHFEVMGTLRGLQRQIGRVEDRVDSQGQQLATHLAWSAEWSRAQERADRAFDDRLEDLEETVHPEEGR